MAADFRKEKLPAHLLGEPRTATVVWTAKTTLECAVCERPIEEGALFTRALAEGYGRRHVPHCRACRAFQVELTALAGLATSTHRPDDTSTTAPPSNRAILLGSDDTSLPAVAGSATPTGDDDAP